MYLVQLEDDVKMNLQLIKKRYLNFSMHIEDNQYQGGIDTNLNIAPC